MDLGVSYNLDKNKNVGKILRSHKVLRKMEFRNKYKYFMTISNKS